MSKPNPRTPPVDAPLRPRLVVGWSLFYAFVFFGMGAAFWVGRSVPVLLDVMAP